jgi:hypothetical protein
MLGQLHAHGYQCAMASAYSYEFLTISAPYAARQLLRNVHPGGVIVLHDGGADRVRTVAVLERVLPALRDRGYGVVTLSGLVEAAEAQRVDQEPHALPENEIRIEAESVADTRAESDLADTTAR